MPTAIVGVDAATQAERTGLAFGARDDDARAQLEPVEGVSPDPARQVAEWLRSHASMARLLALDVPLGWPSTLGPALCVCRAGHPLGQKARREGWIWVRDRHARPSQT